MLAVLAEDDHPRYGLFQTAIGCVLGVWTHPALPHLEQDLLALITSDPDHAMSQAAIVYLVDCKSYELDESRAYARWLESIRDAIATFEVAVTRGREWILVKQVLEGVEVPLDQILSGTIHLQEQLTQQASSDSVLAALEADGRTRKVRYDAAARRKQLSHG
jgi:hypothetical protein